MASRKKQQPPDSDEAAEKKDIAAHVRYENQLAIKGDKDALRQYRRYVAEHERRIRRLQREARGEFVPGDYDDSYQ